jgi:D-glycero-D-manno-heptose 1,7-bisphosphate phosphatase
MIITRLNERYTFRPALYLDWDGTVRRSKSGKTFIQDQNDIEIIEGAEEAIQRYRQKGFLICGITNQGGVAYGFKTFGQIDAEVRATIALFKENPWHSVEACLFMPGGTVEPYRHASLLRKPNYGMLVKIEEKMFAQGIIIDYKNSLFVGDRQEDEQCAHNAGIGFMPADMWLKPHPITIVIREDDRKFNDDLQKYQDELYGLNYDDAKATIIPGYGTRRRSWDDKRGFVYKDDKGLPMIGGTGEAGTLFFPTSEDSLATDWFIFKL